MANEDINSFSEAYFEEQGIDPMEYRERTQDEVRKYVEEAGLDPLLYLDTDKFKESDLGDRSKRALRAYRQFEIERELEGLEGQSAVERLIFIRERLFQDIESLYEQPPNSVRVIPVSNSILLYPNAEQVGAEFFPSYIRLVDSLYESVAALPEGRGRYDAAKRLCAVAYCLGILIHPYPDGNGQTFRLLTTSYLRELTPEFDGWFFKVKLGKKDVHSVAVVPEEAFADRIKREENEYREFKAIHRVRALLHGRDILPDPTGFICMHILKELNSDIRSIADAKAYLEGRGQYLDKRMETNFIYTRDSYEQRLKALASIRGSFHWPTLGIDQRPGEYPRLDMHKREHERVYYEIEDYFIQQYGERAARKVNAENALTIFKREENKLKRLVEEDLKMEIMQQELEDFLTDTFTPEMVNFIHKYVLPTLVNFDTKNQRLLDRIFTGFIVDIFPHNRSVYMEEKSEHGEAELGIADDLKRAGLIKK